VASARRVTQPALPLRSSQHQERQPTSLSRLKIGGRTLRPTRVFETYWRFAAERQAIFFRRLSGSPYPWTDDPILARFRFTNAYRASDRVSQYLINNVIRQGDQSWAELFFRIVLFKIFNRIETWEYLTASFGSPTWADFRIDRYDSALTKALEGQRRLYSPAYIIPDPQLGASRKHSNHLKLLRQMMIDEVPAQLAQATSLKAVYEILRSYKSIGPFLGYQYAIDCNYSKLVNFDEMDYVVPGPGARDGISKCFEDLGGFSESDVIRIMADIAETQFERLGITFPSLFGRRLQLVDCQNLFCEVDKYARVAHPEFVVGSARKRIKQKFKPLQESIQYRYPDKWGLLRTAS